MNTRRILAVVWLGTFCVVACGMGAEMKITSAAFENGGNIPAKFSRKGGNRSPALKIDGLPANAKSLVLIVDDPDAPGGLFTHWMVWNIDPKTTSISEGSAAKGSVEGTNGFGDTGYDGPQPPSGTHRYYFKIFALDRTLNLPARTKRRELDAAMKGHIIAQGQVMGRYSAK